MHEEQLRFKPNLFSCQASTVELPFNTIDVLYVCALNNVYMWKKPKLDLLI